MPLPNLSNLNIEMNLGKRDKPSADTPFGFIRAQSNITEVDWVQIFEELKTETDAIVHLRFKRKNGDGTTTVASFFIQDFMLRMPSISGTTDTTYCVEAKIPVDEDYPLNRLFVQDFFYGAFFKEFTCFRVPSSSNGPNMVMDILSIIASKTKNTVALEDTSKIKGDSQKYIRGEYSQELTNSLWYLRGFGYYEARGFISESAARCVVNYNESQSIKEFDPRYTDMFVTVFQFQLDWIHECMTASLSSIKETMTEFAQRVVLNHVLPRELVEMLKLVPSYFDRKAGVLDRTMKLLSDKIPNDDASRHTSIRGLEEYTTGKDGDPFLIMIAELVSIIPNLQVQEDAMGVSEFPGSWVKQPTFTRIDPSTGEESIFRMGVVRNQDQSKPPTAILVKIDGDIQVDIEVDPF